MSQLNEPRYVFLVVIVLTLCSDLFAVYRNVGFANEISEPESNVSKIGKLQEETGQISDVDPNGYIIYCPCMGR